MSTARAFSAAGRSAEDQSDPSAGSVADVSDAEELMSIFRELTAYHDHLDSLDHYEVLGVENSATRVEIRSAFFEMASILHPDFRATHGFQVAAADSRALDEVFHRVQDAYAVIGNDAERRIYDGQRIRKTARTRVATEPRYSPEEMAKIHFVRGKAHLKAHEYHEAVESLREAVRLDPSKVQHHFLLARGLTKNPKWRKQAEDHFRKALELEPFNVDIYLGFGELYEESGLLSRACRIYEEALELVPDNDRVRKRLSAVRERIDGAGSTSSSLTNGFRGLLSPRRG